MYNNNIIIGLFLCLLFSFVQQPVFSDNGDSLNVILPDFQVNEDAGPFGGVQEHPSIAADKNGNYVITWMDSRDGYPLNIYAQRYSGDGTAIGTNFRINDFGVSEHNPSVASDSSGNFVITWLGYYNEYAIYAQRFSKEGKPVGPNFKVNNEVENETVLPRLPEICSDNDGNFVIAWYQSSNSQYDICAQRYANDGSALGSNFRVNESPIIDSFYHSPAVSVDNFGNFVIAWMGRPENRGYRSIYAQCYSSDGSKAGANFLVNDEREYDMIGEPSIATGKNGNFMITWFLEWSDIGGYIYAQSYLKDGSPVGMNFKVTDKPIYWDNDYSISVDHSGTFMIIWSDDNLCDIYAQCYNNECTPLGSNFKVTNDSINSKEIDPVICSVGAGEFVITWKSVYKSWENDIYAVKYSLSGNITGESFKVNDDPNWAKCHSSSIAIDKRGNFFITWVDYRYGYDYNPLVYGSYGDIFGQWFSKDGNVKGINFKISDDTARVDMSSSSNCIDSYGNYVITWCDNRNGDFDIYAQRYTYDGQVNGGNFKVNDDQGTADQKLSSIATDSSGNFLITWQDGRNGAWDIYAQLYSNDGTIAGQNFRVSDESGSQHPSVSGDGQGNFIIAWDVLRHGYSAIFVKRYSNYGFEIGTKFEINDGSGYSIQEFPDICMSKSADFMVTWVNKNKTYADIYAQRYTNDGNIDGENFKVNDDPGKAWQGFPSIAVDNNNNFIVTWEDRRNDIYDNEYSDIYAQRYLSNGQPVGANYLVTKVNSKHQSQPDITLWNGCIYTTWTHNIIQDWSDNILANVLDWINPVDIRDSRESKLPNTIVLSQNYPNPFNAGTIISYQLPVLTAVELSIYNNAGQKVTTLVSGKQQAGSYHVTWDANDVASGIYICRLVTGTGIVQSRKLILLK